MFDKNVRVHGGYLAVGDGFLAPIRPFGLGRKEFDDDRGSFAKVPGVVRRITRDEHIRVIVNVGESRRDFDLHVVDERLAPMASKGIAQLAENIRRV